jgi:hypothetical protein
MKIKSYIKGVGRNVLKSIEAVNDSAHDSIRALIAKTLSDEPIDYDEILAAIRANFQDDRVCQQVGILNRNIVNYLSLALYLPVERSVANLQSQLQQCERRRSIITQQINLLLTRRTSQNNLNNELISIQKNSSNLELSINNLGNKRYISIMNMLSKMSQSEPSSSANGFSDEAVCNAIIMAYNYAEIVDLICCGFRKLGEILIVAAQNGHFSVVELLLEENVYERRIDDVDIINAMKKASSQEIKEYLHKSFPQLLPIEEEIANINRTQSPSPYDTQEATEANANQSPVFSAKAGALEAARESIAETTLSQGEITLP